MKTLEFLPPCGKLYYLSGNFYSFMIKGLIPGLSGLISKLVVLSIRTVLWIRRICQKTQL